REPLLRRHAGDQERDEHDIVDAEYDLQRAQRNEARPGMRIGQEVEKHGPRNVGGREVLNAKSGPGANSLAGKCGPWRKLWVSASASGRARLRGMNARSGEAGPGPKGGMGKGWRWRPPLSRSTPTRRGK